MAMIGFGALLASGYFLLVDPDPNKQLAAVVGLALAMMIEAWAFRVMRKPAE
jgi:hypothetical protein